MSDPNKTKRTSTKATLTRFISHFDKAKSDKTIDLLDLENRLIKAEELLELFNEAQLQIEMADVDCEANYEAIHAVERQTFEDRYYQIISTVRQFLNAHSTSDDVADSITNASNASAANFSTAADPISSNCKLPSMNLPNFDGSFDQWLFFRDSFNSIIHNNDKLTNVQKFHYLRLSLQGTAADILTSLQVCDANYAIAWQLLTERFENKPLLVNNHIKELFNLSNVPKDSHQALRQLLDNTQKHLRALKVLNCPTEHWDDLIIYITTNRLDSTTRRDWELRNTSGELPPLSDLLTFLKERCRLLESLSDCNNTLKRDHTRPILPINKKHSKSFHTATNKSIQCHLCKREHAIYYCSDFLKLSPSERLSTAKRLRLCINCLAIGHHTRDCRSSGCRKCGKIHHSLLHFENTNNSITLASNNTLNQASRQSNITNDPNSQTENSSYSGATISGHVNIPQGATAKPQILLSTAVVKVFDNFGKQHDCRILLDNGSQSNFISERLCNILQLPKQKINIAVSGVSEMTHNIKSSVSVTFKSSVNNFERNISCLVLTHITGNLPYVYFDRTLLNIPKNIILADKDFEKPAPVDLLIGADTFWDILSIGQIKLGQGLPILHKTTLGWIISGPLFLDNQTNNIQYSHFSTSSFNPSLESQVNKFWELEECPKIKFLSKEETYCENHFKQHTSQNTEGRFIVSLPFKESPSILGDSKIPALKRFLNLEQKLEKNPGLKLQYHNFIKEYIELGHMSKADPSNNNSGFYLPHHCVMKESSTTTKIRVVFDGSAKSSTNYSLNDIMMVGPNIQDNLFLILLRFREHNFVLSADIEKMYRQVLITYGQRNLQKILWRFDSKQDISEYILNTITYGTASAAFLAIRSLHEVAYRHLQDYPKFASIILHDFYVDDLLTGCDTLEGLRDIKTGISSLLQSYGFTLRKWITNDKSSGDILQIGDEEHNKTLGLLWNSFDDCLQYSINISETAHKVTKRQILSCTAQIFDPLGLLSPVTITAEIILKELWKLKLDWDESIPEHLHTLWSTYCSELTQLNTLKIPRHVLSSNSVNVQLHGFSDASQSAYGACIYICCADSLGNYTSNLYCSKTRVAPMKHTTIPRLELSGALLLAELTDKVLSTTTLNLSTIYYWCDSTTVISWINTSPHRLKTFVANRVSQIQNLSKAESWKYIKTTDNPADLLSRGLRPSMLTNSSLWFHGPYWLSTPKDKWPCYTKKGNAIETSELPELRNTTSIFHITTNDFDVINRYSSLKKLTRVFAYVLRFKNNTKLNKNLRNIGPLTVEELQLSNLTLIQMVQRQTFPQDYVALSAFKKLHRKSKLLSLNPFFDKENKIIRVGGRIENSHFDFDKKHPVILPANHHFTTLIARHEHTELLHAGPQALLASLRERYWPISGRNLVKKIVHDCIRCFRFSKKCGSYLMGNLPRQRITPSRPFSISGVDYAGPFFLRDRNSRNYKTTKSYIALFICFASKAVHLEVVSNLTTQCFLAALRRFMSRRGKCSEIFSDNGTTFVGANNELKTFFNNHNHDIFENLSNDGIRWTFIPPRAPHFGGLWESGVKSVKYHLKRVIGDAALTYEEFCTVMCQIEACLNSRPLCPLSDDPTDTNSLTPAHLLIGSSLTTVPDHNYLDLNANRLSRYQRMQQLLQQFWHRWTKEYIPLLQQRTKWKENCQQQIKPGVMVLVKEDCLPPLKRQIGRIIYLHYGKDNIARSVTIKTSTGIIVRPVVKICVLPHNTD